MDLEYRVLCQFCESANSLKGIVQEVPQYLGILLDARIGLSADREQAKVVFAQHHDC